MKKLLIATACLMAASAYAGTATYSGTATVSGAGGFFGNASAPFTISLDTTQELLTFNMNFSGLSSAATSATLACCSLIAAGGAPTSAAIDFSNLPSATSGSYSTTLNLALASSYDPTFLANNGGTAASAYQALVAGLNQPVGWIDIYAGGARPSIAGQIVPTPVPEPASYALMALGLGIVALRRRQRRD